MCDGSALLSVLHRGTIQYELWHVSTTVQCHASPTDGGLLVLLQKHKGRLSGSLDVGNRGTMDRMFSTPLANKEQRITHRISKDRADFWKEEKNQPKDKKDNHTGTLTCVTWSSRAAV